MSRAPRVGWSITLAVLLAWSCWTLAASDAPEKQIPMDSTIRAPEFPPGFAWLNTDRPLQFRKTGPDGLQGQVVLLDFWTYCCINCMHVLPDLAYLEQKFKDEPFLVVGVHSAKFDNEGKLANVRSAVQRYGVRHPVIVDERMRLWESYAVNSWPTLVLVGPDGRIVGAVSGEGNRHLLETAISETLKNGRAKGLLAAGPLQLKQEGMVQSASGLAFPAKVVADETHRRLFIVDSNHHRIVVTDWPDAEGRVQMTAVIGSGNAGAADGDFAHAAFFRPQGAALAGEILYLADTENHLIRRVDLSKQAVSTVLGAGKQTWDREGGRSGRQQGLNSPWDVAVSGTKLYISMAGQHQLFVVNTLTWMAEPLAGSGRENILDGPALEANLAQPSGLTLDAAAQRLYFADSEVSAIRYVDLATRQVKTIIGHGLFDFGDVDGDADRARFQHPLGVCLWGNKLLVADTYNHKLRLVDPERRTADTFAGLMRGGTSRESLTLDEPAGVAAAGATLFVADTNHHRVVLLNTNTNTWRELVIEGLDTPRAAATKPAAIAAAPVDLAEGKAVRLKLAPKLPPGHHLTAGAPISVSVMGEWAEGEKTISQQTLTEAKELPLEVTLPEEAITSTQARQSTAWRVRVDYTHCAEGPGAVCTPRRTIWRVPVRHGEAGLTEVNLSE